MQCIMYFHNIPVLKILRKNRLLLAVIDIYTRLFCLGAFRYQLYNSVRQCCIFKANAQYTLITNSKILLHVLFTVAHTGNCSARKP